MAEINTENNIKNTQSMDEHKTYMDRILTVPSLHSLEFQYILRSRLNNRLFFDR